MRVVWFDSRRSIVITFFLLISISNQLFSQSELKAIHYKSKSKQHIILDKNGNFDISLDWEINKSKDSSVIIVIYDNNEPKITIKDIVLWTYNITDIKPSYEDRISPDWKWYSFDCIDESNQKCGIRFKKYIGNYPTLNVNANYLYVDYLNVVYKYKMSNF